MEGSKVEEKTDASEKQAGAAQKAAQTPGAAQQGVPPQGHPAGYWGYYYPPQYYYPVPPQAQKQRPRSQKPAIAGGLLVLAGVIGLIFGAVLMGSGYFLTEIGDIAANDGKITYLQGTVSDSSGNPIDNVTVTVAETHLSAKTGPSGTYTVSGVTSGYKQVTFAKEGYNTLIYWTYIGDWASTMNPNSHDSTEGGFFLDENNTLDVTMTEGSGTFTYGSETPPLNKFFEGLTPMLSVLGAVAMACAALALVGGYFAIRRKNFAFAVVGAIAGIFSIGFVFGAVLALIALFVLLLSGKEFNGDSH